MAASYEVRLLDASGNTLDVLDEWISLSYNRVLNNVGRLVLALPGDYQATNLKLDGRVLVVRDGRVDTETAFLVREIEKSLGRGGERLITVTAYSATELLDRRVVAYSPDSAEASKSDRADSLMCAVVAENLGSSAAAGRDVSAWLSVATSPSLGPTVERDFSYDVVLDVLRDAADAAAQAGSAVYFDVVAPTYDSLEFRTYYGLRGADHSFPLGQSPVVLSPERGNLVEVSRSYDWAGEVTFAYAGSLATSASADVQSASSGERIGQSPFNRREQFVVAQSTSGSDALVAEARLAVQAGRPIRAFVGQLVNVPGSTEYGVHWKFGDRVTAEFEGETVDCLVDVVQVEVRGGQETITARLRVEET